MSGARLTDEQVDRCVRAANPVPDVDELAGRDVPGFEELVDRYVAMTTLADEPVAPFRRPVLATLALAATVVLVVGALLLLPTADDRTLAPGPNQPSDVRESREPTEGSSTIGRLPQSATAFEALSVVEEYIDARNDHDPVRARAVVSDDFQPNEHPPGYRSRASMQLAFEFDRAFRNKLSEISCRAADADGDAVRVTCEAKLRTVLHDVGGFGPEPRHLTAIVDDGRIVSTDDRIDGNDVPTAAAREGWSRFLTKHPDVAAVVERAMQLEPDAVDRLAEEMPHYVELYQAAKLTSQLDDVPEQVFWEKPAS